MKTKLYDCRVINYDHILFITLATGRNQKAAIAQRIHLLLFYSSVTYKHSLS